MDHIISSTRQRIDATNCDLANSSFTDVNLANAKFVNINLAGATFSDVNLANTVFENINFDGADLSSCSTEGMRIRGVLVSEMLAAYEAARS